MLRRKLFIGGFTFIGLLALFYIYCLDIMHKENSRDFPLVIAHRGASGVAPENTLAAVNKALELNVDQVEVDVHLSKDGEVIVIHDATLDRTTNGSGAIKDKTLAEIKELDAGSWKDSQFANEPVPTLSEVMEAINGKATALIEIKMGKERYPGLEQKVIDIINKYEAREWAIIQSFESETVEEALRIAPEIETHKLIGGALPIIPAHINKDIVFESPFAFEGIAAINPYFKTLTPRFVNQCHDRNLKVFTWTVNEVEEMKEMIELGVDGVITNYPEKLINYEF